MTITFQYVKDVLNILGLTISKYDGEYRVNFARGGSEETAYYTDDLDDAYGTGIRMADRLAA